MGALKIYPEAAACGKVLRHLREQQGLSLSRVATRAGFSKHEIYKLEMWQINISVGTLAELAQALGVSWSAIAMAAELGVPWTYVLT